MRFFFTICQKSTSVLQRSHYRGGYRNLKRGLLYSRRGVSTTYWNPVCSVLIVTVEDPTSARSKFEINVHKCKHTASYVISVIPQLIAQRICETISRACGILFLCLFPKKGTIVWLLPPRLSRNRSLVSREPVCCSLETQTTLRIFLCIHRIDSREGVPRNPRNPRNCLGSATALETDFALASSGN